MGKLQEAVAWTPPTSSNVALPLKFIPVASWDISYDWLSEGGKKTPQVWFPNGSLQHDSSNLKGINTAFESHRTSH